MLDCNTSDLWKRVKMLCKQKKISQEALCEKLGFNLGSYKNRISRSIAPDVFDVYKIAYFLNVSMEFLVTGEELSEIQSDKFTELEQNYKDSAYRKKYESLKDALLKALERADKVPG